MADGLGLRWKNYQGTPKHLVKINGVTLLQRITSTILQYDKDAEVIITTHNKAYETEGATLYEPKSNELEIDRFTRELIGDDICFMYGDTYYTEEAIKQIVEAEVDDLLFFGAKRSIVGIKVKNGDIFKHHFERVRQLYLDGKIKQCIGWQVYLSFQNQDLPLDERVIKDKFILFEDNTNNFNTPEDLQQFADELSK